MKIASNKQNMRSGAENLSHGAENAKHDDCNAKHDADAKKGTLKPARTRTPLLCLGLVAYAAVYAAAQQAVVVGSPAAISAPTYPFTSGGEYHGEFEQIYNADAFTAVSSAPVTVYGAAFSSASGGTPESPTYQITVYASSTSASTSYANANGTEDNFAANYGPDRTLVFRCTVTPTLQAANTFDFVLPFAQPFVYNPALPAQPNLLLDIFVGSDDAGSIATPFQQTASAQTDSIFYADGNLDGSNNNANVAGQQGGLYTKFLLAPVPEPSPAAALSLGVLGLIGLTARARCPSGPASAAFLVS